MYVLERIDRNINDKQLLLLCHSSFQPLLYLRFPPLDGIVGSRPLFLFRNHLSLLRTHAWIVTRAGVSSSRLLPFALNIV